MKLEAATEALATFFNDLIGALVPGTVLAVGLAMMHLGPSKLQNIPNGDAESGVELVIVGLLFALGHALLAVHEHGLRHFLQKAKVVPAFNYINAAQRESYKCFLGLVEKQQNSGVSHHNWSFNDLRNVALSVSSEAASLGRRFMFISLLCNGVGTALAIICLDHFVCRIFSPDVLYPYEYAAHWSVQLALFIGVIWALFKQGNAFFSRAMTTPFSIAVADLKFKKEMCDSGSTA